VFRVDTDGRIRVLLPQEPWTDTYLHDQRELEVGADRLKRTPFQAALFSADNGTVFLGSSPVGFVVVLGDKEVNIGLVQWALRKALATLEGAWGSPVNVPERPEDM